MVDVYLILAGFGIGVALAAPGGPVNILCVQRSVSYGFWAGMAVGIGAVIGDGLLAIAAASGLSVVSGFMQTFSAEIQLAGGMILLLFGLRMSRDGIEARTQGSSAMNPGAAFTADLGSLRAHLKAIPQSFLLTVTNPGAMLGAFALFGGLASVMGSFPNFQETVVVVIAFVIGNFSWWLGLATVVSRVRHRVSPRRIHVMNRFAGIALIAFGALLVLRGTMEFDVARVQGTEGAVIATSFVE